MERKTSNPRARRALHVRERETTPMVCVCVGDDEVEDAFGEV
jgi:hypothetical protein